MDRWIIDTEPSLRFPVYTRANAGEVLPDPVSPLAWTLTWAPGTVLGWRDSQVNTGTLDPSEVPDDNPGCVGIFGGYFFINASMARIFGVRAPGLSAEMVDFVYFGSQPDVPPYVPHPEDERPDLTEKLGGFMIAALTASDLPELRDDRELAEATRENRPELFELSDAELVARARSFQPELRRLFERHLTVTAGGSVGSGVIQMASAITGDPTKAMRLLAGLGDVDSAAPSWAMWELSRIIRESPALTALFDAGVDEASDLDDRLRTDESVDAFAFAAAIDEFLFHFGSRGPNEWDIQSPTWETRPSLVYAAIDRMRFAPDSDSPQIRHEARIADRQSVSAEMHEMLSGDEAGLAQFTMGEASAKAYLTGRERAKTNIIKVLHEVRMAIHELGMRAVDAGVVDDPFHVTMLTDDELDAFIHEPATFSSTIAERLAAQRELAGLEPPFFVNGVVPPLNTWQRKDAASTAAPVTVGEVMAGVPGCPGVWTGVARVILDPSDPAALAAGDVLVAPVTDPSWTPLFVAAGAVVVDVGAQVSHAVIVSRELGLPCVVSVTGATKRIPSGATVEVNGTRGTVTVVALP